MLLDPLAYVAIDGAGVFDRRHPGVILGPDVDPFRVVPPHDGLPLGTLLVPRDPGSGGRRLVAAPGADVVPRLES